MSVSTNYRQQIDGVVTPKRHDIAQKFKIKSDSNHAYLTLKRHFQKPLKL